MKIAVCMKQVPATSQGDMDKKTGVMIRSGLQAIVNVYDLAALEAALRIKEQCGGVIHVFTMGPDKAEMVLREAFAMGADEGYLICDKAFAGADVLATSYTLTQAIKSVDDYDMILCGRQTTDGDTAQVSGDHRFHKFRRPLQADRLHDQRRHPDLPGLYDFLSKDFLLLLFCKPADPPVFYILPTPLNHG